MIEMNVPFPDLSTPPDYVGTFPTVDGLHLFEQHWKPADEARAAIVLMHGLADHSLRYAHLATHLARQGYAIFSYDHRGHGRSTGRRAYVDSFDEYLDDLGAFLTRVHESMQDASVFLFGHSMGGAIATLYVIEREADLAGLILSSPALQISDSIPPALRKAAAVVGRMLPRLPTLGIDRTLVSHDPQVVAQAQSDPLNFPGRIPARTGAELLAATHRIAVQMHQLTLPLLLIHGTADKITDPAGSTACYREASSDDKTLAYFPDFYHETFNEPGKQQVLDEISDWLNEHTS